jgi:hypothetical protein
MFLKQSLVLLLAILAVLAFGALAASAKTAPVSLKADGSPSCPAGYSGPTNPATGCPYTTMS